ncbi:MAG: hypothetical protein ACP5SH_24310 [Syntrophobacteraceae bacterium]
MKKESSIAKVGVLFFLAVILAIRAPLLAEAAPNAFFSSGQAVLDPQNQAKSQQQAIQNFMAQGLTEAMASFLSPDQLGAQLEKLQKSVLAEPQKYIQTYQVYSEKQAGGVFQVIGKVTVSMDLLKKDLAKLGVLGAQSGPAGPAPATALAAPSAPPAPAVANGQSLPQKPVQAPAPPPVAATPAPAGQNGAASLSRGISPTKKEILWAVTEKWDEKWVLPTDRGDIRCIFARSMAREMDGFGFSLLLPQSGSVEMDNDGNIPPFQAVSLAKVLGVKDVVVGKISYVVDRQNNQVSLNADLQVIRSGTDQTGVQIRKTLSMEDLSNDAGAVELARRIGPQLSGLLGGPKMPADKGEPGSAEFPVHLGKLVVRLASNQYAHWTEVQHILRLQFQTMHVDDLQIGPTETTVKLDGIDGGYLLRLNGTQLPSGVELRIDSYSIQAGAMQISFVAPAKVQAETK